MHHCKQADGFDPRAKQDLILGAEALQHVQLQYERFFVVLVLVWCGLRVG
jgi:hypothetical protein